MHESEAGRSGSRRKRCDWPGTAVNYFGPSEVDVRPRPGRATPALRKAVPSCRPIMARHELAKAPAGMRFMPLDVACQQLARAAQRSATSPGRWRDRGGRKGILVAVNRCLWSSSLPVSGPCKDHSSAQRPRARRRMDLSGLDDTSQGKDSENAVKSLLQALSKGI